jgi:hypothetical protein
MEIQLKHRCWLQGVQKKVADPLVSDFVQRSAEEEYSVTFLMPAPVVHSPLSEKERSFLNNWLPDDPIYWCRFEDPGVGWGLGFFNLRLENTFPINIFASR